MKNFIFLVLLSALYGLVFPLAKKTLLYSTPLFITGTRMMLAGGLMLAFEKKEQYVKAFNNKKSVLAMMSIAFFGIYLTNLTEFWGVQYLSAAKASFIYSFSPIATAFISFLMFKEKINLKQLIGIAIAILGFLPELMTGTNIEDSTGKLAFFSFAEIALITAATATSIGWVTMRYLVKHSNASGTFSNAITMFIGGIMALAHSYLTESWSPFPITEIKPFLGWFVCLTIVSNIICYNLHTYMLKIFSATYIALIGLSQAAFSALFGWMLLRETSTIYLWISMLFVTIGLYIYYHDELKNKVR